MECSSVGPGAERSGRAEGAAGLQSQVTLLVEAGRPVWGCGCGVEKGFGRRAGIRRRGLNERKTWNGPFELMCCIRRL